MRPESLDTAMRKAVCEGYKGTCEDIVEIEDEEMDSTMRESGIVNGKFKIKPIQEMLEMKGMKENSMNSKNKSGAQTTKNQNQNQKFANYLSPRPDKNVKASFKKEVSGSNGVISKKTDSKEACSTDVKPNDSELEVPGPSRRRVYNNKTSHRANTVSIDHTDRRHDNTPISRWIDFEGAKTNNMQNSFKNQKNEELGQTHYRRPRNFELNKLFKRTLNSTTQSFHKNKNKSDVKLDCKLNTNDNKSVSKRHLTTHKVHFTFMDTLNDKNASAKSFDHPIVNSRSLNSFVINRRSESKSSQDFESVGFK